jgi:hypothetical protein
MRSVWVVAFALALGACASVTRGWNNQVQFHSNPPGAEVRTSMGHVCITPCTLQFGRKDEFVATFSKAGYETQHIQVNTRIAPGGAAGFAGNVILGGVVGAGVDVASGATLEHCPNPVTVTLRPTGRSPRTPEPGTPVVPAECNNGPGPNSAASTE